MHSQLHPVPGEALTQRQRRQTDTAPLPTAVDERTFKGRPYEELWNVSKPELKNYVPLSTEEVAKLATTVSISLQHRSIKSSRISFARLSNARRV